MADVWFLWWLGLGTGLGFNLTINNEFTWRGLGLALIGTTIGSLVHAWIESGRRING